MTQIQGLAAHAAGAELLPFRYDPGELGPARSRDRNHPLRHLPQRHSPDLERLGHQPVSVHSRATRSSARSPRWARGVRSLSRRPARGPGLASRTPAASASGARRGMENLCARIGSHLRASPRRLCRPRARQCPLCHSDSRQRWTASMPRRCCAAASPSTTRCARMASTRRRAWALSASADSDTWPFSSRASSARRSRRFPPPPARKKKRARWARTIL